MSFVTRSVLEEMESELLESLESRESKINTWSNQAKHILDIVWRLFCCNLNGFIGCMLTLAVLSLTFFTAETVTFLTTASADQLVEESYTAIGLSQIVAFLYMVFNIVTRRIAFVSIKRLKEEAIAKRVDEAKRIAEIAEEVLVRHELISIEDKR